MRLDEEKRLQRLEELLAAALAEADVRLLVNATRSWMDGSGHPLDPEVSVPISPRPEYRELVYFAARRILDADRETSSLRDSALAEELRRARVEVRLFDQPSARRPDVRVGRRFRRGARGGGMEYRITWRGFNGHGEEGIRADEVGPEDESLRDIGQEFALDAVPPCYD